MEIEDVIGMLQEIRGKHSELTNSEVLKILELKTLMEIRGILGK